MIHFITHKTHKALMAVALLTLAVGCNRVPDHVISPDTMAPLMADLSVAESVVEMNYSKYSSDSSRKALKQAVLARYDVNEDKLDTSLVWYGSHLDIFMDICDDANDILQDRIDHNDAVASATASASVSGDSVDVWAQARQYRIDERSAGKVLTFRLKSDNNTQSGDIYTWRAKIFNMGQARGRWGIVAEYTDGVTELLDHDLGGEDWHQLTFYTDSTRTITRIYGYMRFPEKSTAQYIDSIELIRKRLNSREYVQRYKQRSYSNIR